MKNNLILNSYEDSDKSSDEFNKKAIILLASIKSGTATKEQRQEIRALLLQGYVRGMTTDVEKLLNGSNNQ